MSYNPRKEFTALDLAPTYLELLGIKLPEHAFGLGRSLFSDVPSLISLPEAKLETAIRQKSKVYDKFSILPPQKFVSYRLGTRLLNKTFPLIPALPKSCSATSGQAASTSNWINAPGRIWN